MSGTRIDEVFESVGLKSMYPSDHDFWRKENLAKSILIKILALKLSV